MAEQAGHALVIGEAQYAHEPPLAACDTTARAVAARLRDKGFSTDLFVDENGSSLRAALSQLIRNISEQPSQKTFVYFCGYAGAIEHRVFALPNDVDLDGHLRLETEGVLFRQFAAALHGTDGVVLADVATAPNISLAPSDIDAIQQDPPSDVFFKMSMSDRQPPGSLGQSFIADGLDLGPAWHAAPSLQATAPLPPPLPPQSRSEIASLAPSSAVASPIGSASEKPQDGPEAPEALTSPHGTTVKSDHPLRAAAGKEARGHERVALTHRGAPARSRWAASRPRSQNTGTLLGNMIVLWNSPEVETNAVHPEGGVRGPAKREVARSRHVAAQSQGPRS